MQNKIDQTKESTHVIYPQAENGKQAKFSIIKQGKVWTGTLVKFIGYQSDKSLISTCIKQGICLVVAKRATKIVINVLY